MTMKIGRSKSKSLGKKSLSKKSLNSKPQDGNPKNAKPKTARCILYREDTYLLAVHSSFWGRKKRRWGIPGGSVEWGEEPEFAAARELREELYIDVPNMQLLGDYHYKRAYHRVMAASWPFEIDDYDDRELLDLRWFSRAEVFALEEQRLLHAGYEAEAIRDLLAHTE